LPDEWDSSLSDSYRTLLTSEETERYSRFVFEKDRRQFLLTRALERDVLSRYLGVEPSELKFTRNEFGKPVISHPFGSPITYSLSHTKGLSVCAVGSGGDVGVDVESLQRANNHAGIAKRFFATSEADFLESLDENQKPIEFLRLWTLKEAFVKARGLGLSIPLNSFEIEMIPKRAPCVSFPNGTHGHEADWRFLQIRLGWSFQIAIARTMTKPKEITVKFSAITPLTEEIVSVILEPNVLNEWVFNF
jgi:4'-phosphopantetheinyl transferase